MALCRRLGAKDLVEPHQAPDPDLGLDRRARAPRTAASAIPRVVRNAVALESYLQVRVQHKDPGCVIVEPSSTVQRCGASADQRHASIGGSRPRVTTRCELLRRSIRVLVAGTTFALAIAMMSPIAYADPGLKLRPGSFGPNTEGAWKSKQGRPDSKGNTQFALFLQKNTLTADRCHHRVHNSESRAVSELTGQSRYTRRRDCGCGAPRWNLVVQDPPEVVVPPDDGSHTVFLGCASADHSELTGDDDWIKDAHDADAIQDALTSGVGEQAETAWHARGHRLGSTLPCQAGRYDARQLCLEAGVAYLVVVGEDGACRCPFGVRRQQRVGRLSGTTALPPSHDKTHQLTNPREHLFPRLAGCGGFSVSLRVWRSKQGYLRLQTGERPGRGRDRGRSRPMAPLPPEGALIGRQPLRRRTAAHQAGRVWRPADRPHPSRARYRFRA